MDAVIEVGCISCGKTNRVNLEKAQGKKVVCGACHEEIPIGMQPEEAEDEEVIDVDDEEIEEDEIEEEEELPPPPPPPAKKKVATKKTK